MRVLRFFPLLLIAVTSLAVDFLWVAEVHAQRGRGGGARPSMARVGGGGARPSVSLPSGGARSNVSRPSMPNMSTRAVPSRPSLGNANVRTSIPQAVPQLGGARPSLGGAGSLSNTNRPNTNRPSGIATSRPSLPTVGNRPAIKPPSTLPATTLPGSANRPVTLPGNIGRPGGVASRPGVGGGNVVNRPSDRPVIGGNRPSVGKDTNINIGNSVNVGNQIGNHFSNRPRWDIDPGYSRPAWGLNGNNWHQNWHNNCIHHHHHWYNGCWHGYWGSGWYAPVAWGAVGWGLGTITNGWGYTTAYYNPYYADPVVSQTIPYDYSQPVVVNNYVSMASAAPVSDEGQASPTSPAQEKALASFDQGLAKFKSGQYAAALSDFNIALKELPNDVVVHEVRCLALFANGDYRGAAAGLNALLSAAPGMDWTTMSGLYGSPDDYTTQLRKLEQFCQANPNDSSAHFVLAYHYLVTGSNDAAIDALRAVVKNQPKDVTAKRMLDAMVPSEPPQVTESKTARAPGSDVVSTETDLVGTWVAETGGTKIELTITDQSQFTWKASSTGQSPVNLKGQLKSANDAIELETLDQGAIAGSVKSRGPDHWLFAISGAPSTDPGMSFLRKK